MRGEDFAERIGVGMAEAGVVVATPAFGVFEAAGHFAESAGHFVHGDEVGIHALGDIEPGFLGGVRGESGAFPFVDGRGVDEEFGQDKFVEWAAQAVGHGVVDRDFVGDVFSFGRGAEVGHAAGEGGGDGEAGGVDVVFHVILRRMDKEDGGGDFADDGGELAKEGEGVEDFEVVAEGFVILGAQDFGGVDGFAAAGGAGLGGAVLHAAAIAAGEGQVMDFEAGFGEEKQGASHHELDVIGMRDDGQDAGGFGFCGGGGHVRVVFVGSK